MKKIFILLVVVMVFAGASTASAQVTGSSFILEGKRAYGYSGSVSLVGQTLSVDGQTDQVRYVAPVVGNTAILDISKRLLIEDVAAFFGMVERAGIRF